MKLYNNIKKEIILGLEKGYYVSIEFISNTIPLKIAFYRQTPINLILERIKFILLFYDNILNEKGQKIIVNWDCIKLETHIFVEVNNG